jgi:ABC-type protease/lipase transport system fused ATPase/permease subunit
VRRLDERIRRSKRWGKIVLGGVLLASLLLGVVMAQGLLLALEAGRDDLLVRAGCGLVALLALNVFSVVLTRRQHRMLDEARKELEDLVSFPQPHQP